MERLMAASRVLRTLRTGARSHPLVAFITLAYAITWTAWFFAHRIDLGAANGFSMVGSAGPALAGFTVSALVRPQSAGGCAGRRWRLFCTVGLLVMALLAARRLWFTQALLVVAGRPSRLVAYPSLAAILADLLTAGILAFFFSGVDSPRQGVREYLISLDQRRQPARWYWCLAAVTLYPAVVLLGNSIWVLFGLSLPVPQVVGPWYWLVLDAVLMFMYVMFGGGGLEEPGWRGFALPLLERSYTPCRASLILAVIWAVWHWPLFWLGYSGGGPFGVLAFMLGTIPLSMLLTAVYNRSSGSLPLVILLHTSFNITAIYLPPSTPATGLWMLITLVTAVWMWRKPQTFSLRCPKAEREPRSAEREAMHCDGKASI